MILNVNKCAAPYTNFKDDVRFFIKHADNKRRFFQVLQCISLIFKVRNSMCYDN
jgi:hypothetical protein